MFNSPDSEKGGRCLYINEIQFNICYINRVLFPIVIFCGVDNIGFSP